MKALGFSFCVVAFTILVPRGAWSQTMRGTVVDSVTGAPVGVGFVVLRDLEGREVARALTSEAGAFEIRAPGPGTYRLRSERIGYRPWESPPQRLAAGATVTYTARVNVLPVRLNTIDVTRETTCGLGPDESRETGILWEEARKALAAASWNARQRLHRQTLMSYERDLDRRRQRTEGLTTEFTTALSELPYKSIDATVLAERGYIVEEEEETWYYAPDANVLLDESFHITHCFRAVRAEHDGDRRIGLAFEPVRARSLPDVRGVLWIDESSAELRSLEYSYSRVPGGVADERLGGTVEFLPMQSGAWIVYRWQIRMPKIVEERQEPIGGGARRRTLSGFRDVGGEVLVVTSLDGDSIYVAPLAHVAGTVVDSTAEVVSGLPGAVVSIVGTGFSGVTDWQGRFRLSAPIEGAFRVTFSHARLDSLGIPAPEREIELVRESTRAVDLAIAPMRDVLRVLCDGSGFRQGTRVVHGVVRDRFARPVAGAQVRAWWQDIDIPTTSDGLLATRDHARILEETGEDGRYAFCGLPVGRPITILASLERREGGVIETDAQVAFDTSRPIVNLAGRDRPSESLYAPDPLWKLDLTLHPDTTSSRR